MGGQFNDWIEHLLKKVTEEKNDTMLWEFFLHKVNDMSFTEWKESLNNPPSGGRIEEAKKEDIIARSSAILSGFNPEDRG